MGSNTKTVKTAGAMSAIADKLASGLQSADTVKTANVVLHRFPLGAVLYLSGDKSKAVTTSIRAAIESNAKASVNRMTSKGTVKRCMTLTEIAQDLINGGHVWLVQLDDLASDLATLSGHSRDAATHAASFERPAAADVAKYLRVFATK